MLRKEKDVKNRMTVQWIRLLCLITLMFCVIVIGGGQKVQGADVTEFLNIEAVAGTAEIAGAGSDADWVSNDNAVATFADGQILGHSEGIATLKIRLTDGSTKTVHVSVYTKYPLPRTAEINSGQGGLRLLRKAEFGSTDYTGSPLLDGQLVEVLYRVQDKVNNRLMQYVRTVSGDEGYIPSTSSNDRAMNAYYQDAVQGDVLYGYSHNSGTPFEDTSWTSGDNSIAAVRGVTYGGYRNQSEITAKSEGMTPVTAIAGRVRTSVYISVYVPMSNVRGIVKNTAAVRSGASPNSRAVSLAGQGRQLTISGRCGQYWRMGTNQFILMSDVDIPATGITLSHTSAVLYTSGNASSMQLKATISPIFDGQLLPDDKVTWSSSDDAVAQVSDSGLITAKSGGKAVITALIDGQTARCTVTVCVPATKVTMPLVKVLAVKKSASLRAAYTPKNVWGNTITWTSSSTNIARTDNKGKITALSKEGNAFIQVKSNPMTPTVGTKAKVQTGRTLVSVYKPQSLTVMTRYANRSVYYGATTTKGYGAGKIKDKGTLLQVIGSSKNYYYVRYLSDTGIRVFIRKSDVVAVTLIHKTVNPSQKYTLKVNGAALLKASKSISVSAAVRKGNNVTLNRAGRVYDGTMTTKSEGVSWIQINRTSVKNKNNPKIYVVHITVAGKIPQKTGYTTKSVKTCLCAGNSCVTHTLAANTRITILSQSGSYFSVSYSIGGKEYIRFIAKSAAAYIDFAPVILRQGNTRTQGITYYGGISGKNTVLKSVTVITPKGADRIASAKIQSGRIKINAVASKQGYRVLKITAQVTTGKHTGTYTTYAPLTVFEQVKRRNAYIRVQTDLKNGASAGSSQCTSYGKLNQNRRVTLIGRAGNFYLIHTGNEKMGYGGYGFVKKRDLVYLELSRTNGTMSKNVRKLPTITVKIYNASGGGWSGTKGVLAYQELKNRMKTSTNRGIEYVTTRVYQINPSREGTADTIFTCGVLKERCFVSSYTPVTDVLGRSGIQGYINTQTVSRRIAGTLSRYSPYGTVVKNTAVQVYGKCGAWMRVRFNNQVRPDRA